LSEAPSCSEPQTPRSEIGNVALGTSVVLPVRGDIPPSSTPVSWPPGGIAVAALTGSHPHKLLVLAPFLSQG
jgi:hypothetical protein